MPRIVAFTCPHCGAALSVDADDRDVTCRFCQVKSVIHRTVEQPMPPPPTPAPWPTPPGPFPFPPPSPPIPNTRALRNVVLFAFILPVVLITIVVGVSVALLTTGRPRVGSTGAGPRVEPVPAAEPEAPRYAFAEGHHGGLPLFTDANRDGTPDVLVLAGYPAKMHLFDGKSGDVVWTADVGGASYTHHIAIAESRVLVAGDVRLTLLDPATGKQVAKATLEDRVRRLCAPSGGKLRVLLDDDSVGVVDPSTGAASAEKKGAPCDDLLTARGVEEDTQRRHYPAKHLDPTLRALRCGNIQVSGTWNYLHRDPCGPALGAAGSKLGDLGPDFVIPTEVGQLVVGRKARGRRTPMIGLLEGGRLRWSATLSSAEPAELPEKDATRVVPFGTHVAGVYPGAEGDHLAIFDLRHGKRVRDVALPVSPHALRARGDGRLVLIAKDRILLADRLGKVETLVGPK